MFPYFIVVLFLCIGWNVNSQSNTITPALSKSALTVLESIYDSRPHYLYNNSKDTITLSSINPYSQCSCSAPKVVSIIQIDGIGAKEIVFHRKCKTHSTFYSSSFPVTNKTEINKYEIWNLDSKALLFEAVNYYKDHSKSRNHQAVTRSSPRYIRKTTHYQYNFTISKEGKIKIKQLRGKSKQLANIKEGIYTFVNGKYERKE